MLVMTVSSWLVDEKYSLKLRCLETHFSLPAKLKMVGWNRIEIVDGAKDELGTAKLPQVDCATVSFQTPNTESPASITVYTENTGYVILYMKNNWVCHHGHREPRVDNYVHREHWCVIMFAIGSFSLCSFSWLQTVWELGCLQSFIYLWCSKLAEFVDSGL